MAKLGAQARLLIATTTQGTKTFAAAAEAATDAKIPWRLKQDEPGRFAYLLYETAANEKALPTVQSDLNELAQLLKTDQDFADLIETKDVPFNKKLEALDSVLGNSSELMKEFMEILVDKKKLNSLGAVISRFDDIASYMRGEVKVKVTTARDMNQKLQEEIESSLKQLLKPGQTLLLEKNVDPSIIGGVVIEVQDQNVDGSVANRVKQLQKLATDARS